MAALAGTVGACPSKETTAKWKSWSYDESEVLTAAQQVERERGRQADFSTLAPWLLRGPTEIPSNMLSEQERRAIQERHAAALRERTRQQAQAVQATGEQANRIRRSSGAARSRE